MQLQVSGKVGSLVGWLVGWVDHVRHCRRLSNFPEKLVVGGGTTNGKSHKTRASAVPMRVTLGIYMSNRMAGFLVVNFLRKRNVSTNLVYT